MQFNKRNFVEHLYRYGHFQNPRTPTGITTLAAAKRLTWTDGEMITAIKSAEDFLTVDYDAATANHHGRQVGTVDGEIGPAIYDVITMPRCGHPDYAPDVAAAVGSGSWGAGCDPNHVGVHTISVSVNTRGMPSFLAPMFEQVWAKVVTAAADIGCLFIRDDGNTKANIQFSFERLSGSTIGLAIVGNRQHCKLVIWCKYDPSYNPTDTLNQWARLIAHEHGHNWGLGHSRGGIMNPSIVTGPFTATAWRGDPSEGILRRWFGGIPVQPAPDSPVPVPPTKPGKLWLAGDLQIRDATGVVATYIPVPKPSL